MKATENNPVRINLPKQDAQNVSNTINKYLRDNKVPVEQWGNLPQKHLDGINSLVATGQQTNRSTINNKFRGEGGILRDEYHNTVNNIGRKDAFARHIKTDSKGQPYISGIDDNYTFTDPQDALGGVTAKLVEITNKSPFTRNRDDSGYKYKNADGTEVPTGNMPSRWNLPAPSDADIKKIKVGQGGRELGSTTRRGGNLPTGAIVPKTSGTVRSLKNSYEPKEFHLSEDKLKILKEIKQPLREIKELPKTTKLKGYRPNFKGRFSPQNTPDVTASKQSDDIVSGKNASRQVWTAKDKFWKGYETTERMNVIYDNLGHGSQYFDRIVGENVRLKNKKSREVQEHLNMLAHQKAMREVYGIIEYENFIDESETFDNKINDPLFTKVAKRLKKEIDYPKKPAAKGYPDKAPPKVDPNSGYHPKFGKRYKYDKLDPISAKTMAGAPTGDPEIDANVKRQAQKEDWRSDLKNLWLGSEREDWKKKLEEGMNTSDTFSYSVSGKGDVDLSITGTGYTEDGVHQLANIEPMINVSDPTNAGKKFGKTHGYNNTYGAISQYDSQSKQDAGEENRYWNNAITGPNLDNNSNLRFADYIYPFDRSATQAEMDIGAAAATVRGDNDTLRAVYPTNVFGNRHKATPVVTNPTVGVNADYDTAGMGIMFGGGSDSRDPKFFVPNPVNTSEIDTVQILASLSQPYSITSAGSQLQLFYWSGDKPGFQSLYPANPGGFPRTNRQNDGWRPIAMKPSGETDSSVNSNLIDIEKPADYLGHGVINKFSVKLPEWCRTTSTRFMFVQLTQNGSWDQLVIYKIGYQRRNALTINTTLADEKASAFVRVGNNSQMSPEERKKKLNDMLKASREYMLKSLGFASLFNDEVKISDVVSNTFDYEAVMQGSGAFGNSRFNDLVSLEKRQAQSKKYRSRPKTRKRSSRFRGYQRTGRDSKGMTTRARVNPKDIIGSI